MLHLISLDLWVVEGVAEPTLVPAVVPKLFQNLCIPDTCD